MSWQAGAGSIAWGRNSTVRENTTKATENKILPKENAVLVMDTDFKLVKK